jgi:hypothetical protein
LALGAALLVVLWLLPACGGGGGGGDDAEVTPEVEVSPDVEPDVQPEAEVIPEAEQVGPEPDAEVTEPIPEVEVEQIQPEEEEEVTPPSCADQGDPDNYCKNKCSDMDACHECKCDLDAGACVKLEKAMPEGAKCCLTVADCEDDNACTQDMCEGPGGRCLWNPDPTCCPAGQDVVYFQADFEQGQLQPLFSLQDDNPDDSVTWQVDSFDSHGGAYALYFGETVCHTYYTGKLTDDCLPEDITEQDATAVYAAVETEDIPLGAECVIGMTFWAKFEGEAPFPENKESSFDQLKLYVRLGGELFPVFASAVVTQDNTTGGGWSLYAVDLTQWLGETIKVRFEFNSVDDQNNNYMGAFLDDIMIRTVLPAGSGPKQCDAGTPCGDDLNPCTDDKCLYFVNSSGDKGLCPHFVIAGSECCQIDDDCQAGGACEEGTCNNGQCEYALDGACCKGTLEKVIKKWDFNADLGLWTVSDSLAEDITWQADATAGTDGSGAVYFGKLPDKTYDNGDRVAAKVTSDEVVIPDGAAFGMLTFNLWMSTEWDGTPLNDFANPLGADVLTVYVKSAGQLNEVWDSDVLGSSTWVTNEDGSIGHAFKSVGVDVSPWKGKAVEFVFEFDSIDGEQNAYGGVVIDDVVLQTACSEPCNLDADCDDNKPCTSETCVGGTCNFVAVGVCCPPIENCNDENPCTVDSCAQGMCKHSFSSNPECCSEGPVQNTAFGFEDGSLDGFTVTTPADSKVAWQITTNESSEGLHSLWFGNAGTGTYDNYDNDTGAPLKAFGSVKFPAVTLPPGGLSVLQFDLRLDTEWWTGGDISLWEIPGPDMAYDKLTLYANGVEVWNSFVYELAGAYAATGSEGEHLFLPVEAALRNLSGLVELTFTFDSLDGNDNGRGGVFLDNLRVYSYCTDYECVSSMDCDDGGDPLDACTHDKCLNKMCDFVPTNKPGCCYPVEEDVEAFEGGDTSMNLSGGTANVKWQVVSGGNNKVHGGTGALYFGDVATHKYTDAAGGAVAGDASWDVAVPADDGYVLEWWQYLALDAADLNVAANDRFSVNIVDLMGANPGETTEVFTNKPSYGYYGTWAKRSVSLDLYKGHTITVFFQFDSGDSINNNAEGVYLDDVRVYKACQ